MHYMMQSGVSEIYMRASYDNEFYNAHHLGRFLSAKLRLLIQTPSFLLIQTVVPVSQKTVFTV